MKPVSWFCILLLLACSACTLKGTPRDSLALLRTALLDHDADAAMRYINLDSIVDHLVEDALAHNVSQPGAPGRSMSAELGRGIAQLMLPSVKKELKRQLRSEISSGEEKGYFEYIRYGSVWYVNILEDGDTAIVEPKGKSRFKFRMERTPEGYWKIVQIIAGGERRPSNPSGQKD